LWSTEGFVQYKPLKTSLNVHCRIARNSLRSVLSCNFFNLSNSLLIFLYLLPESHPPELSRQVHWFEVQEMHQPNKNTWPFQQFEISWSSRSVTGNKKSSKRCLKRLCRIVVLDTASVGGPAFFWFAKNVADVDKDLRSR